MPRIWDSLGLLLEARTITQPKAMGVIYKILKRQRQPQQQQQTVINMDLSTATKCKVQAVIKQRQLQRHEEHQEQRGSQRVQKQQEQDVTIAEQQLQQLCRFLAENVTHKKRQRLKLQYQQYNDKVHTGQPLSELQSPLPEQVASTHDMDLLMEQLSTCTDKISPVTTKATTRTPRTTLSSAAARDIILLKIRHQIFERKRQRQRQLADLVKHRLVVWRPW